MASKFEMEPGFKKTLDLFHPGDPDEVCDQIRTLIRMGYSVKRCTRFQFKIGPHSYYPGTGAIVTEPCNRHPEKGLTALLDVLKRDPRIERRPAASNKSH